LLCPIYTPNSFILYISLYCTTYFLMSLPNALNHSSTRTGSLAACLFASLGTSVLSITFQRLQNRVAHLVPQVRGGLVGSVWWSTRIQLTNRSSIEMLGRCPISFSRVIYSIMPSSLASLSSLFVVGRSD